MVEINLYGNLRKYAREFNSPGMSMISIDPQPGETVGILLEQLGIPVKEINHIFINSKLLFSRSQLASMFDLPQVDDDLTGWDLSIQVADGDRLGIFGLDMPVLSM
jgi:hypothetical protein